ncbi:MAG: hypothetical protein ABGY41_10385 [Candidatus Poribacteria bacterium]
MRVGAWVAGTVCCLLVIGCGEDAVTQEPTDTAAIPARVVLVQDLDTGGQPFAYADEIKVIFTEDPGTVVLDYDGATPLAPVAGEGLTRAFLLERSPTVLRWDHGGSLVLEYHPLLRPVGRVPKLLSTWPKFDAQHVSFDNISTRRNVYLEFATSSNHKDLIPRLRVNRADITGPDGVTWQPHLGIGGSRNRRTYVTLLRDEARPYERAQTYRVHVEVVSVESLDTPQVVDYEFRIQD